MNDDRRIQLRASVYLRITNAADALGITGAALVAVAVDEYLRARPDLTTQPCPVIVAPNIVTPEPEPTEELVKLGVNSEGIVWGTPAQLEHQRHTMQEVIARQEALEAWDDL
jgi:hypothetical protein